MRQAHRPSSILLALALLIATLIIMASLPPSGLDDQTGGVEMSSLIRPRKPWKTRTPSPTVPVVPTTIPTPPPTPPPENPPPTGVFGVTAGPTLSPTTGGVGTVLTGSVTYTNGTSAPYTFNVMALDHQDANSNRVGAFSNGIWVPTTLQPGQGITIIGTWTITTAQAAGTWTFWATHQRASDGAWIETPGPSYTVSAQGAPTGWTLTWSDEFDGTSLDTAKWTAGTLPWGSHTNYTSNGEWQHYEAANVTVSGGLLRLTARREAATYTENGVARSYPYSSGIVHTSGKFVQRYGRFEMRARTPIGRGFWPGLWTIWQGGEYGVSLYDWNTAWPNEIDIMEQDGGAPNRTTMNLHTAGTAQPYSDLPDQQAGPYLHTVGYNFTDAFHIYGMEWEAGVIRFYLDGALIWTVTQRVPATLHLILMNFAVDGTYITDVDATTPFPSEFQIDWVRVYQRS